MGACKTTRAIEQSTQFSTFGMRTLYINNSIDAGRLLEGGVQGVFTSHNSSIKYLSDKVDSIRCSDLSSNNYDDYEVVIIDEAQFFTDLVQVVKQLVEDGKTVQVYGLVSDFKKEKFGSAIDLIPIADVFEQLTAKCIGCLSFKQIRAAAFTHKSTVSENANQIDAGAFDKYKPMCGKCYLLASSCISTST
jgi:thymidine kinase